jgi:putative lipoprotein
MTRARRWVLALGLALVAAAATPDARADDDAWTGPDKRAHFAASAAIAGGGYVLSAHAFDARWKALVFGGGLAIAAGAGKEALDAAGAGQASWKDLAWDLAGTAAGLGLVWLVDLAVRGAGADRPIFGAPGPVRF